jgi:N-ethylmaleimide reductase
MHTALLTPTRLGALQLNNRVVMAPMTRHRADADGFPLPYVGEYYDQRAGAGLIISEMIHVAPEGRAYPNTPGLHHSAHVEAWRRIVDGVHRHDTMMVAQLAHGGRISHPSILPTGAWPKAPSAIRPRGDAHTYEGLQPFVEPQALSVAEILAIQEQFAEAAIRAVAAGFDGIELHAANGYLLDQFIRDGANQRDDAYGGSPERRARMVVETAAAVAAAIGASRVGVRISPWNPYNDMADSVPQASARAVAEGLAPLGIAYLHLIEPPSVAAAERVLTSVAPLLDGRVILNGGQDATTATAAIRRGLATAASFATHFISNPDLPTRLAYDIPLSEGDRSTFYAGGERGYTDYLPAPVSAWNGALT